MAMMKRLVSALADRAGYTIVPKWQIEFYPGVRYLRRLFKLLGTDLVIDVGANAGQYGDMLRQQVGYQGRIVSFEPLPQLAAALTARVAADPLWTAENRALGATAGIAEFNVMEHTQFSSFLSPRHDDVALFAATNTVRERVLAEITTLDAVLPALIEAHHPHSIYLKLDTQGFDLQVLKGAGVSLAHVAAMQAEASVRPIYQGAPAYHEIIDFAAAQGFVMSGLFPNNEGHFPQLIEFDCHMIRHELVA